MTHSEVGGRGNFRYKGKGDGTFWPVVALPIATGANSYVMDGTAGDFDSDGNLDFLLNGNERFAMFYWGNGDGTFSVQVKDWGDGSYYYGRGTAAGDFNEDGREDIARATHSSGAVKAFLSNGDRTFIETNLVATGLGNNDPYAVAAGDFDEDSHLDLIVAGGSNGDVSFLKGLGNGSFTNITGTSDLWLNLKVNTYSGMDAFDYNGDGHLDLVMAAANGQAYYWTGVGDGTFNTNRATLISGMSWAAGISAPPRPPWVDVNITPADPVTNLNDTIRFTASGAGVAPGDTFLWSFGDTDTNLYAWAFTNGMANMGQTTTHSYTNEGRFLTRLLHTDHNGIRSSRGTWVTVLGTPPISQPGGPYVFGEIAATQTLWTATLDGSASSDDFGLTNFLWSFGDGSVLNGGPVVSHFWTNHGIWNVGLTVFDIVGQRGYNSTTVTFTPGAAPIAGLNGPTTLDESSAGGGVWRGTFYGTNSTDDVGIWKYDWDFGNGTIGSGSVVQGAFTSAGDYVIKLTVTDHAGQTNSATLPVTVTTNGLPVAAITGPALLDEAYASNGVWSAVFYGTNSTDDYGLWKYDWNFGNGTTGTGSAATGSFTTPGNYTITLTVTDNARQTASTNFAVSVKASGLPVPVITGPRLITEATATNHLWYGTWNGSASSDDQGIYQYHWNFGDGASGTGVNITHAYAAAGLYSLALSVTDFGNQTASTTQFVSVIVGEPPTARITASSTNPEGAQPITLSGINSSDDRGIVSIQWTLPPRLFDFPGNYLDPAQWRTANTVQNEKLIVTGNGNWGQSFFFAPTLRLQRGCSVQGRVDTSSGTSYAIFGLKDLNSGSGDYHELVYAIHFNDGSMEVREYGNPRGTVTNYSKGSSYDVRIETKLAGGAVYYLRPADQGLPFAKIFETSNYSDALFSIGADVNSGAFGFDDLLVDGIYVSTLEFTSPVYPGGPVSLSVVNHAGQTNTTAITITPVTGAPPVAVVFGPTNAPAGVSLTYHGYFSSDDHAIANYTWDFGDGSPLAFGPAVSHAYPVPGIYTNTLTVRDYAGQPGVASLLVFVGEGNQLVCVPWRIIGGIEFPHETYSGKTITLKAVAKGVPVPFDYVWDFGDGSTPVTNTASTTTDAYGLEAKHDYFGAEKTPFTATVRITLTNAIVLTDAYPILMRPKSIDTESNIAIDEGLWYLHRIQSRYTIDAQNGGGYWTYTGWNRFNNNVTASAVQAFGINGHQADGDGVQDPYVETVQRGLNYLLANLASVSIGPRTYGNPDANGNGIGVTCTKDGNWNYERVPYELGAVMDAFVAAARPEAFAHLGGPRIQGRTLKELMQDMVDMYAATQTDSGGWRYYYTTSDSDNSVCQWAAIGFLAAERYWGVPMPEWVRQRNMIWLNNTCCFGYSGGGNGEATTPSGLVQLAANGVPTTNSLWRQAENNVANNWVSLMGVNNLYANYAVAKALRSANPPVQKFSATDKDWFFDPVSGLARATIDRQAADGSWIGSGRAYDVDRQECTAWSIIILSSSIFQLGPVAQIQVRPNPTAVGFPVVFDGRTSYHRHPVGKIIEYRWDFDASNGLDFDHPDAYGPVVTNRFGFMGTNTVWLQVRDNFDPQLNSSASVVVYTTLPPYPPTADAGGPYIACVGQDVHLDGSGSFDVDGAQGDYIQSWDWEVDAAVPYDFNDGVTGAHAIITNGYPAAGQYNVGLAVKDATSIVFPTLGSPDLTNVDFTTVFVYNRVITNLVGRAKDNKIQLTWTKAGDYAVVTRSTVGPNRGFVEIGRTPSTYATFLDTNVEYNVSYYYRLHAYLNGQAAPLGISDPVNVVSLPRSFESCGPYFVGTPPHEAAVGKLYEVYLQAKERQNNPFSYVMLAGPTNMTLNTTSGLVRFQPTQEQLGEHFVSFAVTNFCGTNVLSYTLTVFNLTNLPPLVNIHGPYSGVAGQPVQFSSAGTYDPDANALTYVWAFGDGVIDTNANPTHAYPAQGTYTVSLYVNDSHGGTATAQTTANISRANRIPIANAGRDQMPLVGQTVVLDGSSSWDADLDPLNYRWDIVMHPTNSTSTLSNATTARPSFVIDRPGFFVVQLIVNDGQADSAPDAVTIITANSPPVANAGRDQRVLEGNTAQLDGTGSYDVDLNSLTYRWRLVSAPTNSTATLTNANTARPTFGVDLYGLYIAELIVNDGLVDSAPSRVRVSTGNLHPEIVSTPNTNAVPTYPWNYHLLAYDPDGTNLTFTLLQGPLGLTLTPQPAALNTGDTNSALLAWTPDRGQIGSHPVRVLVTDAEGATNQQAFTLIVDVDRQPPAVSVALIQGEISSSGQWAAQLGTTARFRVLATDNVGVTNKTLTVASQPITLDVNGVGSFTASNAGLWQVFATATDAEGNVGVTNTSILFYDPNATNTIYAQILTPTNGQIVTKPVPVIGTITNATDLLSYRVDFARAADVDLGNLAVEGPQFTTLTNVMLPPGTRSLTNQVFAQFDPTMLLNVSVMQSPSMPA